MQFQQFTRETGDIFCVFFQEFIEIQIYEQLCLIHHCADGRRLTRRVMVAAAATASFPSEISWWSQSRRRRYLSYKPHSTMPSYTAGEWKHWRNVRPFESL